MQPWTGISYPMHTTEIPISTSENRMQNNFAQLLIAGQFGQQMHEVEIGISVVCMG